MTFLLPLVALALALAAPFLVRTERKTPDAARLAALALLTILAAGIAMRYAPGTEGRPAAIGVALGAVACVLGAWSVGPAAGVAGAAALHLLAPSPAMGLAFVVGTGLGALTVGGEAAALAGVLVFAADDLGMRHSQLPAAAFVGSQIGVAVAVGALVARLQSNLVRSFGVVLAGIVVVLAGLVASRTAGETMLNACVDLGAVAGVVLHFLMPREEGESPRVGLAAVVGVGLATVAFGLERGAGMGLAALAAVGVLLSVENSRAVLALGPLVGLVMFRVLREAGTGATRALDIGQHYTLLALVLGIALPLLPTDWLKGRGGALGAGLWGVVLLASAPLVVVALGMRGGIGFVVGLGVSGLVQALRTVDCGLSIVEEGTVDRPQSAIRNPQSLLPLALGAGLGGATILALSWLGEESALARDAKLRLFAYAAVGIALIAGMLALAGRRKGEIL